MINSNLVRTALYGEDPNWGRIIAAAGSVQCRARSGDVVGCSSTARRGSQPGAIEVLSEAEAHSELELTDIVVDLHLGIGEARATAWGCDLSKDYVRINASYRT